MAIKDFIWKKAIVFSMNIASRLSDKNLIRLTNIAEKIVYQRDKKAIQIVREKWKQKHPSTKLARRILKELNKKCRSKVGENLFVNSLFIGARQRHRFMKTWGYKPPMLMVISPTMRCNLLCKGCYAGEYTKKEDLDFKTVDRVISEAKKLGTYFITISGGEPYVWPDLLRLFKKHSDVYFQTYTNGTLITKELAKKLAKLGNVAPAISVEGFEEETDARRGKGTFKKVMQAMDNLKEAGVMFGFSATPTRSNSDLLASNEFLDFYINKGCYFGWYFQYIPIGLKPDANMMATPEQRKKLYEWLRKIRNKKPIFIGDFWNDGGYVGGCMAGGGCNYNSTGYLHITCNGNVEPCVFTHFAIDNIKNKSLVEVLNSPFFTDIRNRKPYSKNLLRPCMIIDNPEVLRELVDKYGAKPNHPGADSVVKDPKIVKHLDKYSKEWKEISDELWKRDWAHKVKANESA